jgi:hypothetical protein
MTRGHKIERTEIHTTYIGIHCILSLFSIASQSDVWTKTL